MEFRLRSPDFMEFFIKQQSPGSQHSAYEFLLTEKQRA